MYCIHVHMYMYNLPQNDATLTRKVYTCCTHLTDSADCGRGSGGGGAVVLGSDPLQLAGVLGRTADVDLVVVHLDLEARGEERVEAYDEVGVALEEVRHTTDHPWSVNAVNKCMCVCVCVCVCVLYNYTSMQIHIHVHISLHTI